MATNNLENSEKSLLVYRVPKVMPVNASALPAVLVRASRTLRVFLCLIVWFFTNLPRHVVQRKTLVTPNDNAFVMVLPGSKDKEPSLSTGFHTFASRLCQVGKAILLKENKGEAPVEGSPHYRLLSRRDRW